MSSRPASPRRAALVAWTRRRRVRRVATVAAALAAVLAGLVGSPAPTPAGNVAGDRVRPVAAPTPMPGAEAERVARRVAAAHADVTAVWRHDFRWRLGRTYAEPELVTFAGRRPSACAGPGGVTGLAYCGLDRTLSVDLAFLDRLREGMGPPGARALTLLVARGTAVHVQAELKILGDADRLRRDLAPEARDELDVSVALQGDCLAGVWARRTARQLGPVEAGTWGEIVRAVRDASAEAAVAARLDLGTPDAREAAFAQGYAEGQLRDCLAPGLAGVLG